ncbi:MAG: tetratricopeptide repeat protein [Deltaproteobacteria bacterium]|nr:tetratricopeptide repeat protein [Deltaproteobacteria bacterium]
MSDQQRWDALADALAADEVVDDDERGWLEQFDDDAVEHERALYRELSAQGEPGPVQAEDHRRALATMAAFRRASPHRRRWVGGAVVAAVAVAAALLLWTMLPSSTLVPRADGATVVASGTLMLDGAALGPGDALPVDRWVVAKGDACLTAVAGQGCVTARTRLRVHRDQLEIAQGQLSVRGTAVVLTPHGEVRAEDADFDLVVHGEQAHVESRSGAVQVRTPDGGHHVVAPGQRWPLHQGSLARAEPVTPEATPNPGTSPREVEGLGAEVIDDQPQTADGDDTDAPADDEAGTRTRPGSSRAASAGDLLSAARRHVAAGRSAKALSAYGELRRLHPRSPEAHAANISAGELQLRRGQARAALRSFARYLRGGGGPLAEEAHWGRIRALHRIGKTADRDSAIEALRDAHPSSVYISRASAL